MIGIISSLTRSLTHSVTKVALTAAMALSLLALNGVSQPAFAAKESALERVSPAKNSKASKSAKSKKAAKAEKSQTSRDLHFLGIDVNGRYHSAGEAVVAVEEEKSLTQLIGVRKDFKDRLVVEQARLKSVEGK